MKQPTTKEMTELIELWRSLAPQRALSYADSIELARTQAHYIRAWADQKNQPELNLIWLLDQQVIPVNFAPPHVLEEQSGMTTDLIDNQLQILISYGEPRVRQRYTFMHEWKHALDFPMSPEIYRNLGTGDADKRHGQIEAIANEFAAHVLMPTELVRHHWYQHPNIRQLAELFNVSTEAMSRRLTKLGLLGDPPKRPRAKFRKVSLLSDMTVNSCAA